MGAIFNSLGSNYSWGWVWHSLFASSKNNANADLSKTLGEHYGGQATLTYKGREALEIALRQSGLPAGSYIGINGFTCYAVYRAVQNAGYKTVFVDITPGQLNFGPTELQHALVNQPAIRAIIIQNTLGYPVDLPSLTAFCQKSGLMIIEDLAHSTGAIYTTGQEVGTIGSFTMMSFSQDKPLDVVAGGAVIDRRGVATSQIELGPVIGRGQQLKNRFYPLWCSLIRVTYPFGIGRMLHFGLKKLHLMATPMSDNLEGLHSMTDTTAGLVLERWKARDLEFKHRRDIAAVYIKQLPANIQPLRSPGGTSSYLRFPIWIDNRQSLIDYLKSRKVHISDTWYDVPIGPKKYLSLTDYRAGACPNSEALAQHIVNLPTHRGVTPEVAADICNKIKQWQQLDLNTGKST